MHLEEFYNYKNQLMGDLLQNEKIVDMLNSDMLSDDPDYVTAENLPYKQIYPYEFIPETVEHGFTFICFDVDIQKSLNGTFLEPTLYIWVFTHKSKLRLPEGGVRTDAICSEIAKTINGSFFYGLGELDMHSTKRFAPMSNFNGKVMSFRALDFNRPFNPNKKIPSNRRNGF